MSTTISIFTPQTLSSACGPFPGHGTHLAHHLHYQSITGTPLQSLTSFYHLSNKWSKPPSSLLCIITVSSVAQSRPTLCNPVDFSMPGLPVHHQLPKFAQTHVHWVSDAIQPSHPLSCPSPPAFNLSQHQGLFQWVTSCHQVAKVLEFQLQDQSFQWTPRTDLLWDGLVGSPCSPRDSQASSPTPQFKSINSSPLSFLYSPTLTSIHDTLEKPYLWLHGPLLAKVFSVFQYAV